MGCRVIVANGEGDSRGAVFYCSTTMWAFGPVMDSFEEALLFEKWLPEDPRTYKDNELESKYSDFRRLYTCIYCGEFFEEMDGCYLIEGERYCEHCQPKKKLDWSKAVKEWRLDAEDLEFIPFGQYKNEE